MPFDQTGFVVQHMDDAVRHESTAGGAFTAIAGWIIDHGGVAFGASYTENFMVEHSIAELMNELSKFRNSKYVQSDTKDTFKQVAELLNQEKRVCYSGTPCQVEGLTTYLDTRKMNCEKLIKADVV